jgi:hypothetical protein
MAFHPAPEPAERETDGRAWRGEVTGAIAATRPRGRAPGGRAAIPVEGTDSGGAYQEYEHLAATALPGAAAPARARSVSMERRERMATPARARPEIGQWMRVDTVNA